MPAQDKHPGSNVVSGARERPRLKVAAVAALAAFACLLIASPSAPAQSSTPVSRTPISGFADLHNHQFSNLGFGGLMVWGAPFTPDGQLSSALPWSDWTPSQRQLCPGQAADADPACSSEVVNPQGNPVGLADCPFLGLPSCASKSPILNGTCSSPSLTNPCKGVLIHGPGGVGDLINNVLSESLGHKVGGYPEFDGWPRWNNYTGQQVYHEWLYRAFQGGLKLMVMLGVNNEVLCQFINQVKGFGCEDMPAVDRQIDAAKELEKFVDRQNDGLENGNGWFRIAYSGQQARQIINSGAMAVVLGMEVPGAFGCKLQAGCTASQVQSQIQTYYNKGIRHVFPVHIADNGFGGTALYSEIFSFANKIISGQWWDVENCAVNADADPNNDIEFHLGMWDDINSAASFWNSLASLLGFGADVNITGTPPIPPAGSNCNKKGLTTLGDFLVDEMMKKGMIIDIDHSSAHSFDRILQLAAAERYPGISSGHTGFIEPGHSGAGDKTARHEGNKTPQQLDKLRAVGGIVGAILHQGKRNQVKAFPGSSVPFDCGESSQAWAHMYLYGVSKMQRVSTDRWPEDPVALGVGSDFNGLAGMPAPRYGGEACHGDTAPGYDANRAAGRIPYPFTPFADPGQSMDKMQIGNKVFDYNVDGMANVGMYPDFIRDLQANNMTPAQLAPFFNSAEMYIRAWERSEDNTPPGVSCDSPDGNWHATDVTLNCTAADVISFLENAADASFTLSTNVPTGTETANASTGTRSNICDRRLNCTTGGPVTGNKIDKKAPTATIVEPSLSEYDYDAIVNVDVDATDGGSGVDTSTIGIKVDGVSKAEGFTLDMAFLGLGSHTVEFKVKDNVGNPTTVTKTFVVTASIDALIRLVERGVGKRAPILSPPPIEPMLESWLKTSLLSAKTAENLGSCSATKVNLLAFINKVKSGISAGKITAAYGAILIAGANDKLSRLAC